jgi:hypothetical protein
MIDRIEVMLDTVSEADLTFFTKEDSEILKTLLKLPDCFPLERQYDWVVQSTALFPDHIEWIRDNLSGYAIVEHVPDDGFYFWFSDEEDAEFFSYVFG